LLERGARIESGTVGHFGAAAAELRAPAMAQASSHRSAIWD